jgi:hypothetical protein
VRKAARSQGAYLGVSVSKAPDAREADFLWVMAEDGDFDEAFFVAAEAEGAIRRFFTCESPSPGVVEPMVADRSMFEALFTSFEGSEVVDLLPIPLRRALNFRFVAFMVS